MIFIFGALVGFTVGVLVGVAIPNTRTVEVPSSSRDRVRASRERSQNYINNPVVEHIKTHDDNPFRS